MNKEEELIDRLIDLAFAEDIGDGDHTTLSCIPATAMGKSKLLIKEPGILAGIEVAKEVFRRFDPTMKVEVFINDGAEVKPGDIAMVVEGKVQSLLQTERLMLNIMQRMSGIATMTHKYAEKLKGTNTRVLDTRKTTPGMRILEKMAVKIGGGVNHRIGLFDMILLKDNHVDFAGGIDKAINRAKEYCKEKGKDLKIEIEVRNFDELQQVLDLGGIDRIMFDNFTPEMTKKAVDMVGGRYETESSGGITFDTLRDYAECGVDFISVGALPGVPGGAVRPQSGAGAGPAGLDGHRPAGVRQYPLGPGEGVRAGSPRPGGADGADSAEQCAAQRDRAGVVRPPPAGGAGHPLRIQPELSGGGYPHAPGVLGQPDPVRRQPACPHRAAVGVGAAGAVHHPDRAVPSGHWRRSAGRAGPQIWRTQGEIAGFSFQHGLFCAIINSTERSGPGHSDWGRLFYL